MSAVRTPLQRLDSLTEVEMMTLGLIPWFIIDEIAEKLDHNPETLRSRLRVMRRKLGVQTRSAMALFYVQHGLLFDIRGEPFAPEKSAYTTLGEKLEDWRLEAVRWRLRLDPDSLPEHVREAISVYVAPEHIEKSVTQLAKLLKDRNGKQLPTDTFKMFIGAATERIPNRKVWRQQLVTVFALAPLDLPGSRTL